MATEPLEALQKFRTLEERIARILEALQQTRIEKTQVEKELAEARRQVTLLQEEVRLLRRERTIVRGRVKSLIESISQLSEKHVV